MPYASLAGILRSEVEASRMVLRNFVGADPADLARPLDELEPILTEALKTFVTRLTWIFPHPRNTDPFANLTGAVAQFVLHRTTYKVKLRPVGEPRFCRPCCHPVAAHLDGSLPGAAAGRL